MDQNYNIKNIRVLLKRGFTPDDLLELTYDEPVFRPVYDEFSTSPGKGQIVQRLIEYAERQSLLDHLLDCAKERNQACYDQYQPYTTSSANSPLPPAVKKAVAALDSPNPTKRLNALESLAQMNDPAAREALAGVVQHPIRDVRIQAALMLAQFKDSRALPGLREALVDDNKNQPIGESLANVLKDTEIFRKILQGFELVADHRRFLAERPIRYAAVIVLGEIPDNTIMTDLVKSLHDSDYYVRRISAFILGNRKDTAAIPSLLNALNDKSDGVREIAVMALGKMGTLAIKGLLEAMQNPSPQVRQAAAEALGSIGDNTVVLDLLNILRNDTDKDVRKAVIGTLGKIGATEAVPDLINALQNQDTENVTEVALKQIGTHDALAGIKAWHTKLGISPNPYNPPPDLRE